MELLHLLRDIQGDRSTFSSAVSAFFGLLVLYGIALAIYRLTLDPLARFPGPRLAAATFWYEFYYDVVLGGKYTWKLGELHDRYGQFEIAIVAKREADHFQ